MPGSSHAADFPHEPGVTAAHEGHWIDAEAAQVGQILLKVSGEMPELVMPSGCRGRLDEVIECHALSFPQMY